MYVYQHAQCNCDIFCNIVYIYNYIYTYPYVCAVQKMRDWMCSEIFWDHKFRDVRMRIWRDMITHDYIQYNSITQTGTSGENWWNTELTCVQSETAIHCKNALIFSGDRWTVRILNSDQFRRHLSIVQHDATMGVLHIYK